MGGRSRAYGIPKSEESKGRCEVAKVLLDVWHKAWYCQVAHSKFPEVRERGKVTRGPSVKPFGSEGRRESAVTESLDERKQAEVVYVLERPWPPDFPGTQAVGREGVVEMRDSCDVPRVASHGTYVEHGGSVAGGVGDDKFHEFLWKPGDWVLWKPGESGRTQGGRLRDTFPEQLLDFGLAPPPDLGDKRFRCYCGGNAPR